MNPYIECKDRVKRYGALFGRGGACAQVKVKAAVVSWGSVRLKT